MSLNCLRSGCPWRPQPTDQFCMLCGHALATCEVSPTDGLVFYCGTPADGHRVRIRNQGGVDTRVGFAATEHQVRILADDNGEAVPGRPPPLPGSLAGHGEVLVPAGGSATLVVTPKAFANPVASLQLRCPVLKQPLAIPLHTSESARLEVRHGNTRLQPGQPHDLYPGPDGARNWNLQVIAQQGAVRLVKVTNNGGSDKLQISELPTGGLLLPRLQKHTLNLEWRPRDENKPQAVTITIEAEGIAPTPIDLVLYPRAAIRLRERSRPAVPPAKALGDLQTATAETLYLGSRPQLVRVDLWNEGFKRVRITEIRCLTPQVELREALVGSAQYPCPTGGALPAPVQHATLATAPFDDKRLSVEPMLRSLLFAVQPGYMPTDGLLRFELQFTVQAQSQAPLSSSPTHEPSPAQSLNLSKGEDESLSTGLGAHPLFAIQEGIGTRPRAARPAVVTPSVDLSTPPEYRTLAIELPAQRVMDANASELLCLDFGTVNTSALMIKDGRLHPVTFAEPGSAHQAVQFEAIKSAYRVKSWAHQDIEYGEKVWNSLNAEYQHIDYLPKLRLGTASERLVRDKGGALKRVRGSEGAATMLREVLAQVTERVGIRPTRVRLTMPAAFDAQGEADLRKALNLAGFADTAIELPFTEPEAYLWNAAKGEFLRDLRAAGEQTSSADAEAPVRSGKSGRQARQKLEPGQAEGQGDDGTSRRETRAPAAPKPVLGFVFDLGGGTTDVTLFEYHADDDRIEMIASHGYRWLGGEMLTAQIARLLHQSVPQFDRFPFPEVSDNHTFRADQLSSGGDYATDNFNTVRGLAEGLKLSPANTTLDFSLRDREGVFRTVMVKADVARLEARLSEILGAAIDDTLNRINTMYGFRLLVGREPRFVALAGNGARLWCLKSIMQKRLIDAGGPKPVCNFSSEDCKQGVIFGLASHNTGGANLHIERRDADSHWWYMTVASTYELLLPAGAPRGWGHQPEHRKRPLQNGATIRLAAQVQLYWGPGPKASVSASEGGDLGFRHEWVVDTGAHANTRAQVALGFDHSGGPGLFVGVDGDEWRWIAATRRVGG